MIDPARLFPAELDITFAHIGHAFLGKIVLVAVRIMTAQSGEGHVSRALGNIDVRIRLFNPLAHYLHTLDSKAKVVEARSETRLALQEREADDTVAQMSPLLVVFARLIGHAVGDFFHPEYGLVE